MTFAAKLRSGRFPLALEITPPRTSKPAVLLRRASLLGDRCDAINVIQRPGRQSSLSASLELIAAGITPVWHLTTRGRTRAAIAGDIERARRAGIHQVLCIRGDGDGPRGAEEPTVREAVARVHSALPGALVGATLNQYAPAPERALRNLFAKLEAGAQYVQTQPVYDTEHLRPLVESIRVRAPGTRVVAMVMPLTSNRTVALVEERLGIAVPSPYAGEIAAGPGPAWAAFTGVIRGIVASGLVDGIAVMTYEADASPETGDRIVASLDAAGAFRR